jgi:hypothetical protein
VAAGGFNLMRSLGEIGSMVQKAARGAGIPLGQAEDLGRIAIYIAGTKGDVSLITQALQEPLDSADVRWNAGSIQIEAGAAAIIGPIVRDAFHMGVEKAVLADRSQAPLIIAILGQSGIATIFNDGTIERAAPATPLTPKGPAAVPKDDWSIWQTLAAKTHVPQSDASRAIGAGAGLTDND